MTFDPTTVLHFARLLGVEAWCECGRCRLHPEGEYCGDCSGTGRVLRSPEEIVGEAGKDRERLGLLQRLTTGYGKGWILRRSSTGREGG